MSSTMIQYVEDFNDDNSSTGEEYITLPKPKRLKNRHWKKVREFESFREAEAYISSEAVWSKTSKKTTIEGERVEYRCSAGKYRVNECPAALYLLYHADDSRVSLFTTGNEHDNHTDDPTKGLDMKTKMFIKKKVDDGVYKPNAILVKLRENSMTEPPKSKIVNYLRSLRYEKYGKPTISGTELTKWCEEHRNMPESKDVPFVLKHLINCESLEVERQDLKIVISTLRLLENLSKSIMVQIDATHKVVWQGYPLIIVGTSDKDRVFHPFAIAVCKGETAEDYSFIFDTLKMYNPDWKPKILLADASDAVTQGYTIIFGAPSIRLMCFFHVLKDLEKHFKHIYKNSEIKQDLYVLQTCKNRKAFEVASKLFLTKWGAEEEIGIKEFVKYFNSQWVIKYSNWYEGAAVGYPSTNNGSESINATINKQHNFRERLPVGQFLNNIFNVLKNWSKERDPMTPNFKDFSANPTTSLRSWTEAFQWATLNQTILKEDRTVLAKFYIKSSKSTVSISPEFVEKVKYSEDNYSWETFDILKEYMFGVWVVTINFQDLSESLCTCPYFFKNYSCRHMLGMKIRLKLVDVPPEAKQVPLGQKIKRGRPAKTKKSLIVP